MFLSLRAPLLPCLALLAALALGPLAARAADAVAPAAAPAPAAGGAASAPALPAAAASAPAAPATPVALDSQAQALKADVIALNRDLLVLEEELLFPASTQVAVFLSMDVGLMFDLDSVQLKVDDKLVSNYLYTPTEVAALHRGGVQRLYLGNLRAGAHEVVATFTGKGPHERDYRRGATVRFDKGTEPQYLELKISDVQAKLQPEFVVKVWK